MFVRCGYILVWMTVFAGGVIAAGSAQEHRFRLNLQPGQRWEMTSSTEFQFDGQATHASLSLPLTGKEAAGPRKAVWEVLSVANGSPTAVRITFDRSCANPAQDRPFPFVGQTITVTALPADRHRRFDHDFAGKADADSISELGDFLYSHASTWFYPSTAVAVGQSWQISSDRLSERFALKADDFGKGSCRLLSVGQANGRTTAEITLAVSLTEHASYPAADEPGSDIIRETCVWDLKGRGLVDLDSGLLINEDWDGTINTAASATNGRNRAINLNTRGKVKIHRAHRLLDEVPSAHPTTAPAHRTELYAGTFADDQLVIELRIANGQYTGLIRRGEQRFPLAATDTGRELEGHFQTAEGQRFAFAAALDSGSLVFKTGQTTYRLAKKQHPAP